MKIAFGSVIYPGAVAFLPVMLESLTEQSDSDFDFLLLNDGVDEAVLAEALADYPILAARTRLLAIEDGSSISENRIHLMKEAKKSSYDLLIVGDADDRFAKDRIRNYRRAFEKTCGSYHFYYNDLLSWQGEQIMPHFPEEVTEDNLDLQSNFLGMSISGLNLNLLDSDFIDSLYEGETKIFDWYLYTRILLDGGRGCFVDGAETYYNIHPGNIAGVAELTEENLLREISVKREHFSLLSDRYIVCANLYQRYQEISIEEASRLAHEAAPGLRYWWDFIHV